METDELKAFFATWDREAASAAALMRALPANSYDFRPDPTGRSIGELAWHLAEGDAYISFFVVKGAMQQTDKPPGIERPRTIAELAPGFEHVHAEARARLGGIGSADLARELPFFDGRMMSISRLLWEAIVYHLIHHRAQLSLMCRLAGGVSPGMYGPNREEMAAMRAKG
jgi:uncharacterized damage-inducible protein DinB